MKLFSRLNSISFVPQKVLGLSKMSMLEYLLFRNPNLTENQILSKMMEQGLETEDLLAEHQRQIVCEQNLAEVLKKLDIGFRITKRTVDASKCVKWADLVIPIGGDGTFLLTSKLITNNRKPVLGINPDTSKKGIFTVPPKYAVNIDEIFDKLRMGSYTLLMRSRIRTVMKGTGLYRRPFHIHEKSRTYGERRAEALKPSPQRKIADALHPRQRILPWLALNEVFMGEFLAARPISLIVRVENHEYRVRSSGICVCTGSGSQGWFKSMNYQSAETVRSICELATGKKLSSEETNELLRKYHESLPYPVEDLHMTLKIRELYQATRCAKNKFCPDKFKCHTLTVISRGFDAALVVDGSISMPFNDGSSASFEIKPDYALRNIVLI